MSRSASSGIRNSDSFSQGILSSWTARDFKGYEMNFVGGIKITMLTMLNMVSTVPHGLQDYYQLPLEK